MAANARRAIIDLLIADSALMALVKGDGVYYQNGPQDAAYPFVLVSKASGKPEYTFGDLHEEESWLVQAVDRDSNANDIDDIDVELQRILQDAPLDIDGYDTLWMRRQRDYDMSETEVGAIIRHKGAHYLLVRAPVPV